MFTKPLEEEDDDDTELGMACEVEDVLALDDTVLAGKYRIGAKTEELASSFAAAAAAAIACRCRSCKRWSIFGVASPPPARMAESVRVLNGIPGVLSELDPPLSCSLLLLLVVVLGSSSADAEVLELVLRIDKVAPPGSAEEGTFQVGMTWKDSECFTSLSTSLTTRKMVKKCRSDSIKVAAYVHLPSGMKIKYKKSSSSRYFLACNKALPISEETSSTLNGWSSLQFSSAGIPALWNPPKILLSFPALISVRFTLM